MGDIKLQSGEPRGSLKKYKWFMIFIFVAVAFAFRSVRQDMFEPGEAALVIAGLDLFIGAGSFVSTRMNLSSEKIYPIKRIYLVKRRGKKKERQSNLFI